MSRSMGIAGLLVFFTVGPAWAQDPNAKADEPGRWAVLFRSDDPSLWDKDAKNSKGEQVAIPLKFAPAKFSYLRLRRMDTWESLIIPLTRDDLQNGKPVANADVWWNGTSVEEWKGRHLGIVQGPRHKFPAPEGMISVMNEGWDGFAGSGFGHKCFANDGQYYCWRGKEIPKTAFEISVTDKPLSAEEKRCVLSKP